MTGGYRRSSPGRVGPLMYIAVAVAALLDWVLWAPAARTFLSAVGTALIVVAGVLIIHRTQRAVPGLEEPAAA
jgi:drug/metabolite transporter (DMT)-like permease